MSDQKVAERDMLDIIFADKNKAYGAYRLRRDYPGYVGRALLLGVLIIGLLYAIPAIMAKVNATLDANRPIEVIAEMGPPPDIDPNKPPPPPPPKVETPPPPTRTTVKFVPPVVKKDIDVPKDIPPPPPDAIKDDTGKETKKGTDDAPPAAVENPVEDVIVEAKEAPKVDNTVYEFVEKAASFPGGEAELAVWLSKNVKYPQFAQESNITGRVIVQFVVERDGSISDVKCVKDIGGGCGKEAERVVRSMPKWGAGEQNGRPVRCRFTLPVTFKLN
jgi:periplasmic protein TonB